MKHFLLAYLLCLVPVISSAQETPAASANTAEIAVSAADAQLTDTLRQRLADVVKDLAIQKKCRVTAGAATDPRRLFMTGYDGRENKPITEFNESYEIGSCSKMFTASSILQLVEQEKLQLDDRLTALLPDFKWRDLLIIDGVNYIDSIQLVQLLNHSSGLPEYFIEHNDEKEIEIHGDPNLKFSATDLLRLSMDHRTSPFVPGTSFRYCNLNYILLGMIIREVTGLSYQQYIQENIIDPLGLRDTYLATEQIPETLIQGHYNTRVLNRPSMPPSLAGPAGEIVSTLPDMLTFVDAWNDGRLFKTDAMREVLANDYFLEMGSQILYGLGAIRLSGFAMGHAGQTFGFQSYMAAYPNGLNLAIAIDDGAVSSILPIIDLTSFIQKQSM